MVQIKHLTAPQKWLIFKFQDMQIGLGGTKYFIAPPSRQESHCESNSKPVLVIAAIRPFTCQSFRQNYVSREIEWAVFTECSSYIVKTIRQVLSI